MTGVNATPGVPLLSEADRPTSYSELGFPATLNQFFVPVGYVGYLGRPAMGNVNCGRMVGHRRSIPDDGEGLRVKCHLEVVAVLGVDSVQKQ